MSYDSRELCFLQSIHGGRVQEESATHRNWRVVGGIACVQFALEPQHGVGGILVAVQQEVVLRGIDKGLPISAVLLDMTIL